MAQSPAPALQFGQRMKIHSVPLLTLIAFGPGCGASRTGGETAAEHRAEAARHESDAAEVRIPDVLVSEGSGPPYHVRITTGDLSSWHKQHAEAHRRAAERIEATADAACGALTHEERATCPLETLGIDAVSSGHQGIALRVPADVPLDHVRTAFACHLAEARVVAPEKAEEATCPLFMKAVELDFVAGSGDGTWVVLRSEVPAVRVEIEKRIDAMFRREATP